jgi:hypothetical protein
MEGLGESQATKAGTDIMQMRMGSRLEHNALSYTRCSTEADVTV